MSAADVEAVERPPRLAPVPTPAGPRPGCVLALHWRALPGALTRLPLGSETLFAALYGFRDDTFWLDRCAAVRASALPACGAGV